MFRDKVRAKFTAGKGGDGHVSFGADKKPSGGIGGDGGNVFLEGSLGVYDLGFINNDDKFQAENGVNGGKKNLTGKNGEDIVIKVPLTTKVYDQEHNLIFSISKDGQRERLLAGGRGGLGNQFYRKAHGRDLYRFTPGNDGQTGTFLLELELNSEIIFIGLPNAGKSSIMKEITNADAKVGAYPFTTLIPQLGRLDKITLMDLPGLIEGTAYGKGLGTKFLKHTRSAKIIAHFISLESDDLMRDYETIRKELKELGEELPEKKEIIVLTKSDSLDKEKVTAAKKLFKKITKDVLVVSIYDDSSLEDLKKLFKKALD